MRSLLFGILTVALSSVPAFAVAPSDDPVAQAIALGDLSKKLLETFNATRSESRKLRLAEARPEPSGVTIDHPAVLGPAQIAKETQRLLGRMPQVMRDALLLHTPPGTRDLNSIEQNLLGYVRALDRNAESAMRYRMLEQDRVGYIGRAKTDVRGYSYLTKNGIGPAELKQADAIPEAQWPFIRDALIGICVNANSSRDECRAALGKAVQENRLALYYEAYIDAGKFVWDQYFRIPDSQIRKDVKWEGNALIVPFNLPDLAGFQSYVLRNVEDEFRFGTWKLKLKFGEFPQGPRLVFRPGTNPPFIEAGSSVFESLVLGLNSNKIIIDPAYPVDDLGNHLVQFAIRHEFGHVLGLPDCYAEFYDEDQRAYVSYPLDATDLMCGRLGRFNERIYRELKRVYQPN